MAKGDGIGPEIMDATLFLLREAGARLELQEVELGESVYRRGCSAGIAPAAWDSFRETGVLLKAPITTPQGGGFKSLNVTIRKTMGLYANVRPSRAFHPFVATNHPEMDMVIIRENEEDLYAGIEHRQTDQVYQCLKLITRPGCEKIVRFAFEYAQANGRKRVTCFSKDNIMKLTDGLFHKVFDEVSRDYPELRSDHMIVDIGAARVADSPENFDVIVMPNLYGDIVSDIAAQVAGSVGLAGSANIGDHLAMFEAIHGSAPDIAGKGIANPSGLIQASTLMLSHLGQSDVAELVQNAWLKTLEEGIHTADITTQEHTRKQVGTREFAEAVVQRLGLRPEILKSTSVGSSRPSPKQALKSSRVDNAGQPKKLVGVDVFLDVSEISPDDLGQRLESLSDSALRIKMITNRGCKVWPQGQPETFCTDHWRCRFVHPGGEQIQHAQILSLLGRLNENGLDFIKTENLCQFGDLRGYSLGQGE